MFQVLGGCISGSLKLVSEVRNLHHVLGGTLNPVSHLSSLNSHVDCIWFLIVLYFICI